MTSRFKYRILPAVILALIVGVALALAPDRARAEPFEDERVTLTARVIDRDGEDIGFVAITEAPRGVFVQADVEGLAPGKHGFHFHEKGSCTAPDFTSAGGHYAPQGAGHGHLGGERSHAGDMPNQIADGDGQLLTSLFNDDVVLRDGEAPLIDADGSALVIHASFDDYESQPSGAAGPRVACAVIDEALLSELAAAR